MARLNDLPQPAGESVDTLKRRFVRQNRELARVNSTQSVRIRNLEGEVSRLLSENVSLREQVIKLHYEVENNPGRSGWDKVDGLKQQLETRLAELGGLLQELGDIQNTVIRERAVKRKSMNHISPKRSPNQRNWKNALNLSEVTGESDGRLPPILEDKCFPRRTLDGDDLRGIFVDPNNLADSPDLGPPPIAHFDEGDPIKFDPNNDKQCLDETPTAVLSANLETRKKRRESFHQREPSRLGDGTDPDRRRIPDEKAASVQPLKSGAKRKLDIREEGDRPTIDMENDNFRISRKVSEPELTATKSKVGSKGRTDSSKGNDVRDEKVLDSIERSKETRPAITSTGRKVLGPKSVNSDPQSPAKLAKPSTKPKISDGKDDLMKRIRDRSESKDKQPSGKIQKIVREVEIPKAKPAKPTELPPKTPIPPDLDLLSPTASDPSEPRPGLRDTPPPPDLGPDTGTDSFGRASRRPRCSVSYAEPNLRAKMRRPTKDMVDAVGAEEKIRQAADKKRKGSVSSMETDFERLKLDSTIVKQEEENESSPIWKTKALQDSHSQKERQRAETTSPLGKKAGLSASDLPASVITDRRERVSSMSRKDAAGEQIQPSSGAATAIAALAVTGPKGRRREAGNGATNMKEVAPVVESGDRTSIFDFTGSSPEDVDKRSKSKEELEESTKTLRVLRRHSSVPGNSDRGKGSITISRRRRETILETSELAGELDTSMRHEVESMKSAAVPEWSTGDDRVLGRGERAANRRRSMML